MSDKALGFAIMISIALGMVSSLSFKYIFQGSTKWWAKAVIKAPVYALFCGFGVVGGGNEAVGFAMPLPITVVIFIVEPKDRLFCAVYPFLVWLVLFFLYETGKHLFKRYFYRKNE